LTLTLFASTRFVISSTTYKTCGTAFVKKS